MKRTLGLVALAFALPLACSSSSGNGDGAGSTAGVTAGGTTAGGEDSAGASSVAGGTTSASAATAGGGGSTGAGGTTGPAVSCTAATTGTMRPLLSEASAACFTIKNYLARSGSVSNPVRDDWDPSAGLPDATTYSATYTVAADGSGTHSTVQAAISAANSAGGSERAYILVKPGTYRELVCVKGAVPITLYGEDSDASQITIVFDNYNGKSVDTAKTNACASPGGATYGTSGSTTFFVHAAGFQAQNLTIANDFAEGSLTSNIQAVAATVQGDRAVFQNVHFVGNQDTLQVKTSGSGTIARSYFKNCAIDGDTDFIFGRGTAVFDGCTITYVSGRKLDGAHLAPSTEGANPFGFLIINSKIVGGSGVPTSGTTTLGRAWDDSSGTAPNGQAVIRETHVGAHVKVAAPWAAAATTGRAFSAEGNRLYEFQNTGPGAAGP